MAGANIPFNTDNSDFEDDEESQIIERRRPFLDDDEEYDSINQSPRPRGESFVGQFGWDEDYDLPNQILRREQNVRLGVSMSPRLPLAANPREDTPLLLKKTSKVSFSTTAHPNHSLVLSPPLQNHDPVYQASSPSLRHYVSKASIQGVKQPTGGQSTFGQTVCTFLFSLAIMF